jgi:hypothetical protein
MSLASSGFWYGPGARRAAITCRWVTGSLSWLILILQTKRVIGSRMPTVPRATPVQVQQHGFVDVALEVGDKSSEHGESLLLVQDLRYAVAVRDAEVPRWRSYGTRRVPTR